MLKPLTNILNFNNDTQKIMFSVVISLLPAVFYKLFLFSWLGLFALLTLVVSAVLTENILAKTLKIEANNSDFTSIITALLLFLALNCNMHAFIYFVASFIAIGLTKMCYGGMGKNIFNPAMVAWCFVMVSFPQYMTKHIDFTASLNFIDSLKVFFTFYNIDSLTQATPLTQFKPDHFKEVIIRPEILNLNLAILAGGLYLLIKKVITATMPLFLLLGTLCAIYLFGYDFIKGSEIYILYGPIALTAFYIVTDPVTSPSLKPAQAIFSFFIGFISILIAKYGVFPIGTAFAVVFMNSFNFLLDKLFSKGAKNDNQ